MLLVVISVALLVGCKFLLIALNKQNCTTCTKYTNNLSMASSIPSTSAHSTDAVTASVPLRQPSLQL